MKSNAGKARQNGSAKAKLGVSVMDGSLSIVNTEKRKAEELMKEQSNAALTILAKQQAKELREINQAAKKALRKEAEQMERIERARRKEAADPPTELQLRAMERRKALSKSLKS